MINKTIYIRYLSCYGWTYLISEDYVDDFNIANTEYLDDLWDVGSFNISLESIDYLYTQLDCIKDKIFNTNCFIYIPKKSSSPNPTIKDFVEPHLGDNIHPTITIDNHCNPPLI